MSVSGHTVTINGRMYDTTTGMPVAKAATPVAPARQRLQSQQPLRPLQRSRAFSDINVRLQHALRSPVQQPVRAHNQEVVTASRQNDGTAANSLHQQPQRSQTLVRSGLHQPAATAEHTQTSAASEPTANTPTLKEMLIKDRLAQVADTTDSPKEQRGFLRRRSRLMGIATGVLAVLLLGSYLTYINLSGISMQIAGNKAGIAAKMPGYKPEGYALDGPITYAPGEVAVTFKSDTNNQSFTVKQTRSSWDSRGLLDNYVSFRTDSYLTYQQNGLTVYTYGTNAAWVNGGTFYTVEGSAQLSSDQLLQLATSL